MTAEASPRVLAGTHTFAATGASARRQQDAVTALLALRRAAAVNVQFADAPHVCDGLATLAVLRSDSNRVSGRRGPRKPIVSEVFDALAAEAQARRCDYFCFANGDIQLSDAAIDAVIESGQDAWVFSRQDFDGETGEPTSIEIAGTDVFAMRPAWWLANRHRFRRYIVGEGGWDNIYTAVVLCHADAHLENRRPLVLHEAHPPGPMPSPQFGEYIRLLAAQDAGYFHLWCQYWDRLARLRAGGATEAEEKALARAVFVWAPSAAGRAVQVARNVKAHLRYRAWRLRAGAG